MIYQTVALIVVIILGAILSYAFGLAFGEVFTWLEDTYATIAALKYVVFHSAFNNWMILLVFLIPILIWFFVNIQRPQK